MSRLEKLKRNHIKEVNKLLDKKFVQEETKKESQPLKPSQNEQTFMTLKEVKELLRTIEKSKVQEVRINHPKIKLTVKKDFSQIK